MTVLDACVDIEYEFVYFLIIIIELNNDNNNNDEIKVSKMGGVGKLCTRWNLEKKNPLTNTSDGLICCRVMGNTE